MPFLGKQCKMSAPVKVWFIQLRGRRGDAWWWDVSSVPRSTANKSFFQPAKQISHDFIICCHKNPSHSRETSSPTQMSPLKKENTWQDIAVIEGLCQHNAGTDFIYTFGRYKGLSTLIRPVSNMSFNISSSSKPVFRGNLAILTFISFQLSYLCNQGSITVLQDNLTELDSRKWLAALRLTSARSSAHV